MDSQTQDFVASPMTEAEVCVVETLWKNWSSDYLKTVLIPKLFATIHDQQQRIAVLLRENVQLRYEMYEMPDSLEED
ncbi:MAG: hypothetical protein IRZ03_16390 [Acidobacterium ailaaui]|nr:hypothetical protein [Pseudacidobacterium ailaaui]